MKNEIDNEVREVNNQFSERPIHVKQLKDKVAKIVIQMNTFEDEANDVLINAVYAEKLIQYGNRYRKDHHSVDKSLNEAERLFKNNRYKRSIEISEEALESVEPGITKHIEEQVIKNNHHSLEGKTVKSFLGRKDFSLTLFILRENSIMLEYPNFKKNDLRV